MLCLRNIQPDLVVNLVICLYIQYYQSAACVGECKSFEVYSRKLQHQKSSLSQAYFCNILSDNILSDYVMVNRSKI